MAGTLGTAMTTRPGPTIFHLGADVSGHEEGDDQGEGIGQVAGYAVNAALLAVPS